MHLKRLFVTYIFLYHFLFVKDDLRRNLDMINAESTFKVVSQPLRKCRFENAKTILIEPENSNWNYRTSSIVLNECKTFKFDPKNGARYQFNPNGKHYYFSRFVNENDDEHFILVNISQTISVRASIKYVSNWEEENCQKSWIKKSLLMQLSSSSQALPIFRFFTFVSFICIILYKLKDCRLFKEYNAHI